MQPCRVGHLTAAAGSCTSQLRAKIFLTGMKLWIFVGMYLLDDEGELSTVEVSAKFVNGKPDRIEAKYIMKSKYEWDRFMRFMERYSDEKGLGFTKKKVSIALFSNP